MNKTKITKKLIRTFSNNREEEKWLLKSRMDFYEQIANYSNPIFGPEIKINYDSLNYFNNKYTKINIEKNEFILCDMHTALKKYPEIVRNYYNKTFNNNLNNYITLNSAIWDNGFFLSIPKGKKANFLINSLDFSSNSFMKNIVVMEENTELVFFDYSNCSEEARIEVTEVFVGKNAECKYLFLQDNSKDTHNFSIKKSIVEENGSMEWINISVGSKTNMSYPSCNLNGINAKGIINSITVATHNQILDEGAKIIHSAPNTFSNVFSKSFSNSRGETIFRNNIAINRNSDNSKSIINSNCFILDQFSKGDIISKNVNENNCSAIECRINYLKDISFDKNKNILKFIKEINFRLNEEAKEYFKKILK